MSKKVLPLMAALVLVAGCGHKGSEVESTPPPPAPPPTPTAQASPTPAAPQAVPGRSPRERFVAAIALMEGGDPARARAELQALLAARPADARAALLLREIDTDPHELFGADSFSYTVQPGDTLVNLARRYLRDPFNFYALGRFNELTFPVDLQPGQTIMIPGHARPPEAERGRATRRPAAAAPPSAQPKPEAVSKPAAVPTPAARARAQRLRQQGLEQMSAGSIDRAVQLLSQAAALDSSNGAIAGELARARRIQATVHAR
jgi:hypothetical protein